MLLRRAEYESLNVKGAVFVLGDFNSPQRGRDSGAYEIATGSEKPSSLPAEFVDRFPVSAPPPSTAEKFRFYDVKLCTPRERVSGHYATFTGLLDHTFHCHC
jgi:hypothetical protein